MIKNKQQEEEPHSRRTKLVLCGFIVAFTLNVQPIGLTPERAEDIIPPQVIQEEEKIEATIGKTPSQKEVEIEIRKIAKEKEFSNSDYLVKLAHCESSLNPQAVHLNNSGGSVDRGLFQWNNHYQKQISDQCAFDIRCSTERAIEKINAGGQGIWVCDKYVRGTDNFRN